MRSAPSPSSTYFSPAARDSATTTSMISCRAPAGPVWSPSERSATLETSSGLDLAAMMPLKEA